MLTDLDLDILSHTFLLRGLTAEHVSELLEAVGYTRQGFRRDQAIYTPEVFRHDLGVVLSGSVVVTKGSLTVSTLGAGDLFGAAALFTQEARYVSTLTPRTRCEVLFLSQEVVAELLERERTIRENYIRYLAQRIRFLSAKLDSLSSGTGGRKLSTYILQAAGPSESFTAASMTELASRLSMGRATLYRELDKLEAAGIIARNGKTITLLKPELL